MDSIAWLDRRWVMLRRVAGAEAPVSFREEGGNKMKKLALACVVALTFGSAAMAVEIAISTQGGWMGQGHADTEAQEIVDNVTGAPIAVFTSADLDALADWIEDHTGDGVSDLLVMFGIFPATIYPVGNAQPEGSLAELFLDDGNCIINTGDYIFYVGSAGNNDAGGLANMMDVPAAAMWGDDSLATTFAPTADGQLYTPSLPTLASNRPWFPAQFEGTDWYFELILAQSSDGTQVHPGILRNSVTGGRLGVFSQVSDDTQPRGEVISEWINNWYLPTVAAAKTATNPVPASGDVDVPRDVVLSWKAAPQAVTHDVYFGASFDDVGAASRSNPLGVLLSQDQAGTTFDPPGILDFETTYYWRVDEVNGAPDFTIFEGDVWSFTAEPFAYPIANIIATSNVNSDAGAGPQNTVNGSGLNASDQHSVDSPDMWLGLPAAGETAQIQWEFDGVYKLHEMLVWNYNVQFELILGFGVKDVTVEYSTNGTDWTVLGDVTLNQATAKPTYAANTTIDFGGVAAQYVRLNINSGFGLMGQYGLSEVRFMYIPAQARE
ncbi:MAG TPA: discoidin domain-containing protein, partial [Sedimentisphaerales bacterium]|nr:discoidin domain-containing protein [Sedimentisphaerales bacterium]HOC65511.1 discoidin domain-containing protein [Sedimentisphaerales bacterium]HOH66436.1 discoidin domain-containing protein [Sedimentisphaerales bacterium]HQN35477.1 discoidin domain-containing protein [Sedimentisphaerales bacterium]